MPDSEPPEITHFPATEATAGVPLELHAMVVDDVNVSEVSLHYRLEGESIFETIVMVYCPGCIDTYRATIPGSEMTGGSLEYYINATDGLNYATHPADNPDEEPHVVEITVPETDGPEIFHIPVTAGNEGWSIEIYATLSDESGIQGARLHYRRPGEPYTTVEMEKCTSCIDAYTATIPGSAINATTIEYYIEADDGVNVATDPGADAEAAPHRVEINLYPTRPVLNAPGEDDVTSSSVTLSWTPGDDQDLLRYDIYVSRSPGAMGEVIETLPPEETSLKASDLDPKTDYYFTVRVLDEGGLHADSEQLPVTTKASVNWMLVIAVLVLVAAALVAYAFSKGLIKI